MRPGRSAPCVQVGVVWSGAKSLPGRTFLQSRTHFLHITLGIRSLFLCTSVQSTLASFPCFCVFVFWLWNCSYLCFRPPICWRICPSRYREFLSPHEITQRQLGVIAVTGQLEHEQCARLSNPIIKQEAYLIRHIREISIVKRGHNRHCWSHSGCHSSA
ncbi:hypothetical protein HDK77DRAFT_4943 [Phyllosticta capitalensis]